MASKLEKFIGGFALTTLDSIQKREAYQRELEKERMLQALRMEQAKELADYEDLRNRRKVDPKLSESDFDSGKRVLRNEYGEKIGETDIPASERFERKMELEKAGLEVENVRSQIESRKRDDARQDRYTSASIANMGRSSGGRAGLDGSSDEVTDLDRANELLYRYKSEVGETAKAGNVSNSAIRAAAIAIIENSRDGEEAQRKFLEWLNAYRTGRKSTDERKRTLERMAQKEEE